MIAAASVFAAVFTLVLPLAVFGTKGAASEKREETLLPPEQTAAVETPLPSQTPPPRAAQEDKSRSVRVLMEDGTVLETDMSSYLWGVVAAEMPASFEEEALKAQTAAARTYTLWKALHNKAHPEANVCTDYTCCQAWISREEAAEKWGDQAEEYSRKVEEAVAATDGTVLYFDGQPIQAVFHSSSAGRTQDAVTVWGSTVPYLTAVDTPEGEETPNYQTTAELSEEEVRAALEALGCKLEEEPEKWLEGLSYSANGSVTSAQVGGVTLRGNVLRTALGLRSPSFTVSYGDKGFTFRVTGYGHGVGLSQYGANALAKQGKTWREILSWYYSGVEFGDYDGPLT